MMVTWSAAEVAVGGIASHGNEGGLDPNLGTLLAVSICLLAAAVSSAGGLGGGALFLPILTLVAGLPLKKAAAFTAFMVVGTTAANVLCTTVLRKRGQPGTNYGIAVVSEPSLLVGVSAGVMCNVVLPEWLVTLLFAVVVGFSSVKTCRTGARRWKAESENVNTAGRSNIETGTLEPLLRRGIEEEVQRVETAGIPTKTLLVLALVWICFFVIQVITAGNQEKIIVGIKPYSKTYWAITASQVPLAVLFTAYALYKKNRADEQEQAISHVEDSTRATPATEVMTGNVPQFLFPVAALLAGFLSGLFGIGGGILLNPALLHMGIHPQVTAATCAFMMLFTSTMASAQYQLLGTVGPSGFQALALAAGCAAASAIGLHARQGCVHRLGRPSVIVFAVGAVMTLSTVSMTCLGVLDVWRDYRDGGKMGFKALC